MNPYLLPKREPCYGCRHHAGRGLTFNGTSFPFFNFTVFHLGKSMLTPGMWF
jgi:hypothetical protein